MLYEPEEYKVVVKDGCKIILDQLTDEVFPKYPDFHFEREQITGAVKGVYELDDVDLISNNLVVMQSMLIQASQCDCTTDVKRHELMHDIAKAFSAGAQHVSDTVTNRMMTDYKVDSVTALMIWRGYQMGVVADVDATLEMYGRKDPEPINVPDTLPEDIGFYGPEDFNDTQC